MLSKVVFLDKKVLNKFSTSSLQVLDKFSTRTHTFSHKTCTEIPDFCARQPCSKFWALKEIFNSKGGVKDIELESLLFLLRFVSVVRLGFPGFCDPLLRSCPISLVLASLLVALRSLLALWWSRSPCPSPRVCFLLPFGGWTVQGCIHHF